MADLSEEVKAEEVVELEECAVNHREEATNLKGLGIDDFRGFGFDLLVQEEDGRSCQIRKGGILVAMMG